MTESWLFLMLCHLRAWRSQASNIHFQLCPLHTEIPLDFLKLFPAFHFSCPNFSETVKCHTLNIIDRYICFLCFEWNTGFLHSVFIYILHNVPTFSVGKCSAWDFFGQSAFCLGNFIAEQTKSKKSYWWVTYSGNNEQQEKHLAIRLNGFLRAFSCWLRKVFF